jgi:hypothetical protein
MRDAIGNPECSSVLANGTGLGRSGKANTSCAYRAENLVHESRHFKFVLSFRNPNQVVQDSLNRERPVALGTADNPGVGLFYWIFRQYVHQATLLQVNFEHEVGQ